jgi:eukaryotic-like serine/threonine-protein kinase
MDTDTGSVARHFLIKGRYEILRELGVGGSGCVYAATDIDLEKEVALKLFGLHVQWDRSAREKFELEVKVSGRVRSKHIVQVHDAGLDPMTQMRFIVMELLDGQNLQQLVEKEQRVSPALTVEYLRQVASGLDKAHAWKDRDGQPAPIVHRDLKPSNLFLTTEDEGGSPLVKILDWGIAKMLSNTSTQSTDLRGTPLYMAPERFKSQPITPATDIWNLALVAFFLLTGKHYWKAGQTPNVMWPSFHDEVSEGPRVLPRDRIVELGIHVTFPLAFDDWFMHCAHASPDARYLTAGEAVCALAEVFDPPVSKLTSEVVDSQPRFKAGTSIDGGIAKSPLPPAPARPNLRRSALLGVLLGGLVVALVLAAQNLALSRGGASSNATRPMPEVSQPSLSNSDLPALSAPPHDGPTAPTPAPASSGLASRAPAVVVSAASSGTRPRLDRAMLNSKPVASPEVPAQVAPVSSLAAPISSLAPISPPPDRKRTLDETIQQIQARKQTIHP